MHLLSQKYQQFVQTAKIAVPAVLPAIKFTFYSKTKG